MVENDESPLVTVVPKPPTRLLSYVLLMPWPGSLQRTVVGCQRLKSRGDKANPVPPATPNDVWSMYEPVGPDRLFWSTPGLSKIATGAPAWTACGLKIFPAARSFMEKAVRTAPLPATSAEASNTPRKSPGVPSPFQSRSWGPSDKELNE